MQVKMRKTVAGFIQGEGRPSPAYWESKSTLLTDYEITDYAIEMASRYPDWRNRVRSFLTSARSSHSATFITGDGPVSRPWMGLGGADCF